MTSNIGAQYIEKMEKIGFAEEKDAHIAEKANYEETKVKVMGSLKDYFRPEFLNRVDDVLLFDIDVILKLGRETFLNYLNDFP